MSNGRPRRVLVVDNDHDFRRAVEMLVSAKGYTVFGASSPVQAMRAARRERVHAAVLDIRLASDSDDDDLSGLHLAEQLDPLIVKIMLSAYPSVSVVRSSYGDVSAFTFVEKEEGPDKLFEELAKAFAEKVKINFDLSVRWQGIDAEEVARELEMENKPSLAVLEAEIDEALCKLFYQADEILVTRLIPGDRIRSTSQSGAVLLQVQPRYRGSGWGARMVVKLAAREKIAVEAVNYEQHVDGFIAGFRHTSIHREVRTHLLGAIIYTLVGTPLEECVDLGTFYAEHSAEEMVDVLKGLFTEICEHWYANRRPRRTRDMMDLYARPLKLSVERLEAALKDAGLPDWVGRREKRQRVPGLKQRILNPIEWLQEHPSLPTQASLCCTHGDMHSRNVLVDPDQHAWLIDFYRTGPGHLFRDLVELESDVKFTLLEITDLPSLIRFELALLNAEHFNDAPTIPSFREPELKKAFRVVQGIRHIAGQLADPGADMLDYYQGLLLQTLAMIRLRHIPPPKKRHAYLAAALVCERLEEW
jgi:ActR/RegA family two-component response regulator